MKQGRSLSIKRYSLTVPQTQVGSLIATLYELQSAWLEPKLKSAGMRWTTFQLLATVLAAGEDASQAEVAKRLAIAPATLSEAVQVHVQSGMLSQEFSPTDRRKRILKLTPEAKRKMTVVAKHLAEFESHLARAINLKELESTEKTLKKIVDNLEKLS